MVEKNSPGRDLARCNTVLPKIFDVLFSLICNATSWEVVNESTDSFASFNNALIAFTSKREGDEVEESAMEEEGRGEDGGIDKKNTTWNTRCQREELMPVKKNTQY